MAYSQHSSQHGLDKTWVWSMLWGTTEMPPSELNYFLWAARSIGCQWLTAESSLRLALIQQELPHWCFDLPLRCKQWLINVEMQKLHPFSSMWNTSKWPCQSQDPLWISWVLSCNYFPFQLFPLPVLLPSSLRGVASENICKINLLNTTMHLRVCFQEN